MKRMQGTTDLSILTAAELLNRGLTARGASDALGIGRSSLFKLKAQARARGLLGREA